MSKRSNKAPAEHDEDLDEVLEEKKKARKIRRAQMNKMPEAGELNITAMMDMLTILLVFLLKSYNTEVAANLNPSLSPPESNSDLNMKQSITVAITRQDISVDDKKVLDLQNGVAPESERPLIDQPLLIQKLRDALLERVAYHRKLQDMGGLVFEGNMLVVGDRTIDYLLLSQVLYSAGQAELANFKFVTISSQ